jgi:hypothetical protein
MVSLKMLKLSPFFLVSPICWLLFWLCLLCPFSFLARADSNVVTFPNSNPTNVDCQCIPEDNPITGACTLKNLSSRSPDTSYPTWTITITPVPNHNTDVSLACWRKRDQAGTGVCCDKNDDETDVKYFWGQPQE